MADDWRLTVALESAEDAARTVRALHERELEPSRRGGHGDRIAVSRDEANVFLYTDTQSAAEAGRQTLLDVLAELGLAAEPQLDRWHPVEERWESASVPLPETAGGREAEREQLESDETHESRTSGIADWEVRVELASRQDAGALAAQLEQEGWSVVRRSHYLLVGANDRDDADELARRLERDAPHGAQVHVEPGAGLAWQLMPFNPFSIFGGLGV
jgi:hypothetical protein